MAKGNLSADGTVTMHYDNGDSNTGTLSKVQRRFLFLLDWCFIG